MELTLSDRFPSQLLHEMKQLGTDKVRVELPEFGVVAATPGENLSYLVPSEVRIFGGVSEHRGQNPHPVVNEAGGNRQVGVAEKVAATTE